MGRTISNEEIQVFRELFNSYDPDGDGTITVEEFAKVMSQSPGKPPSQAEVEQIVREVDLDGDGTINFNEFITMMTGQPYPPPAENAKAEEAKAEKEADKAEEDILSAYQ